MSQPQHGCLGQVCVAYATQSCPARQKCQKVFVRPYAELTRPLALEQGACLLKLAQNWLPILLLSVALTAFAGTIGEWPMWRGDPALTGFQPLPGAMKKAPRILA